MERRVASISVNEHSEPTNDVRQPGWPTRKG
jgi:hypothetical protein